MIEFIGRVLRGDVMGGPVLLMVATGAIGAGMLIYGAIEHHIGWRSLGDGIATTGRRLLALDRGVARLAIGGASVARRQLAIGRQRRAIERSRQPIALGSGER